MCTDKILQSNGTKLDFEITIGDMTLAHLVGEPWLGMNTYMMCMIVLCTNK